MRPYLTALAQQRPLPLFFGLAFVFTWSLLPLAQHSIPISLIALCGPAAAAFATSALAGSAEWRRLVERCTEWRVPAPWYAVAFLLPIVVSAVASWLEQMAGARGPIRPMPVTPLGLIVFVLVAGEEIGWRGFALPKLRSRAGPWSSSVVLGIVWAIWHLPLFYLPGMPQHDAPFLPFVVYTIGLSVVLTFLAEKTRDSVIIATLFHGSVNTFGLVNPAASPAVNGMGNAAAYGLAALVIGAVAWRRGRQRSATQPS